MDSFFCAHTLPEPLHPYWNHSYDNARWVEADFENSTLNVRRIAPAGGGWNKSIYEKELPDAHIVNVEGKIYWKDETEKRNVSSICLIFLDQDRKEINRIGYYDTWDSHSGSKWYTGAEGVQHGSVPLSGEAHIRVSRLGSRLQTYWNGEQIFEWAETRQPRYIRITWFR